MSLPERWKMDMSGCWLWTGDKRNGYGSFIAGGRRVYAHRAFYEAHVGPLDPGQVVRHHCDTPACVNPVHLAAGTQAENIADMWERGHASPPPLHYGESHHKAKLTEGAVLAIRAAAVEGISFRELARRYGMANSSIASIVHRRTWNHVHEQGLVEA